MGARGGCLKGDPYRGRVLVGMVAHESLHSNLPPCGAGFIEASLNHFVFTINHRGTKQSARWLRVKRSHPAALAETIRGPGIRSGSLRESG